jgi:hypothetical protein
MPRRCLLAMLSVGFVGLATVAASAAPVETTGASQCRIRGYLKDTDPKGTNIRSAPRADAPLIGHLAPLTKIAPDTSTGVEFEIVGSKDGWLLIQNGEPKTDFKLDASHAADGRGWVSGKLVGVTLAVSPLRSSPRRDAPLVAKLSGESWGPDSAGVSVVHACDGKYVEVTATPLGGKPLRGWSWSPCASQLTTCDRSDLDE